jgi:dephospho-CoA kinase
VEELKLLLNLILIFLILHQFFYLQTDVLFFLAIFFQNHLEKIWLEKIIHPFVNRRIDEELEKLKSNSVVILILPLLFEKNYTSFCSEICYIDCPRPTQLIRLQSREQCSLEEANQRIDAQWNNSLKKQLADHIITNANNDETWKLQLKKLYNF